VVLELRFGAVSVVLPGDIGAGVERALAAQIPPAPRRVLKAAHHGSATSTSDAWLDALRPELVVISCGRQNRFGHPAGSVLGRLRDRGIRTLRTDRDGQVVVETDGVRLRWGTFAQGTCADALTTITKARWHECSKD
jgi:competence protein ComEC